MLALNLNWVEERSSKPNRTSMALLSVDCYPYYRLYSEILPTDRNILSSMNAWAMRNLQFRSVALSQTHSGPSQCQWSSSPHSQPIDLCYYVLEFRPRVSRNLRK